MYEVQHYRSDQLPDSIYQQMSSFIRLVWLNHLKGDDRFWVLVDPTGHVEHFVIAERGVLISHACVNTRALTHAGESYLLRGLGAVFTYPAFRKEGHGGRVVAAATEFIQGTDADVGMLFCAPERVPFYAAHGWQQLANPYACFGDPNQPGLNDEITMMLFLSDKAKARRSDFERGSIYVGEHTW